VLGDSSANGPEPVAAAVTPRNRHAELDFGAGFELIDFLCRARIRGIAFFTSTGEYASLSSDERSRFLCLAIKRSRALIYAGIGAGTLDGALGLAREARDAGAAALMLPPPYGAAYGQDDIREFYTQFAAHYQGGAPVYLIDSPGLCPPIEPATAAELIAGGSFAGIADFVSETACALPELVLARRDALRAGRREEAAGFDTLIREFDARSFEFPSPAGLKTALVARGVKTGPLPVPLSPAKQHRLEEFRTWFSAWLPGVRKLHAHA
jgi:dihydrodipicolinate synthase/N-acetylneuraminate lyase